MGDYQKLQIKKFPKPVDKQDDECRYWKKYKTTCHFKEFAPVTSIDFSPTSPHNFCIASSARVQIYSPKTQSLKKTISRFSDVANYASFRNDGKLIVAGDSAGQIQIFDIASRSILRSFQEHNAPVRSCRFLPNNTNIASVGDDKAAKVFDIPSQAVVHSFEGEHSDYVRSLGVSKNNSNLIASGSYDHTVKVWDLRANKCVFTLDHLDAPVEDVCFFPGDALIATAAGNQLYIWDILGGHGSLLSTHSNHQKTITSLAFNSNYSRLATASLDHQVKIYNVADYSVSHSFKYPSPVLSVAISPDDTHIVAGMLSGLLSVRERSKETDPTTKQHQKQCQNIWALGPRLDAEPLSSHEIDMKAHPGSFKFFLRGRHKTPSKEDHVISSKKKPKLLEFEKRLKSFEFSLSLDSALSHPGLPPESIISLLQDLQERPNALKIALSGRDDIGLEPILKFVSRNIQDPRYTETLVGVLEKVLGMYERVIHSSPIVEELVKKIHVKVDHETVFQQKMQELMGVMEMVIGFSECAR